MKVTTKKDKGEEKSKRMNCVIIRAVQKLIWNILVVIDHRQVLFTYIQHSNLLLASTLFGFLLTLVLPDVVLHPMTATDGLCNLAGLGLLLCGVQGSVYALLMCKRSTALQRELQCILCG